MQKEDKAMLFGVGILVICGVILTLLGFELLQTVIISAIVGVVSGLLWLKKK